VTFEQNAKNVWIESKLAVKKCVLRFVCDDEFRVLLSKFEPVKEEFSLNDLLSPLSGTVKKKEY
jgi:hypothetical protein